MVNISFTNKEAEQIKRSLEFAKIMDGDISSPDEAKRMKVIAHQAFVQGILNKLYKELERPPNGERTVPEPAN